ncbi:hypothetical protein DD873_07335, partial [Staphylococcus pseudintermedius]|uniref:hypothetical protein n=1 Tax=Staphylococcus pseudintermedius TaxID=283734 RepID=UPI000D735EAE
PYIIRDVEEVAQFYQKTFGRALKCLNEHEGKLLHAELEITAQHYVDLQIMENRLTVKATI